MTHKNVKQSHREDERSEPNAVSSDAAISSRIAAPPAAARNDEKDGAQNTTRENTMFGKFFANNEQLTTNNVLKRLPWAACLVLALAAPLPAPADDECGVQVGTIPVECDASSYGSGVTYDAVGGLFIDFTNTPTTTVGGNGVTLTGDGSEDVTFDSQSTGTELQSSGTAGALLGVTTVDGNISIATEEMDADVSAAAVTHAIYAESTGDGSIDINTAGPVDVQSLSGTLADSIGIQAVTGSGDLTITASDDVTGNGAAIDATTGTGQLTINIVETSSVDPISRGIRIDTDGSAVINIAPVREVRGIDRNAITVVGEGVLTIHNDGGINGILDFSGLEGGYTFNNNAGALWNPGFTSGSQLAGGTVNNAGTISLSRGNFVSAPGATFMGMGDGVLELNRPILNGRGQLDCTTAAVSGCLDLPGGTTGGQTAVLVIVDPNDPSNVFIEGLDRPISPGIVVVDVGGGTTQADHFVLHPDSFAIIDRDPGTGIDTENVPIYAEDPIYDSVLETGGLFDYTLLYNPDTQQHLLASVPNQQGIEYVAFIHESLAVWHTTSEAIAGRQADLRDGGQRGGWVRVVNESSDRDFTPKVTTHGNTFTYDHGYSLDTKAIIAGYDMTADDNHVFGVHLGFVGTRLDHDDSSTNDEAEFLDGASSTFGVYGGWWNETGLTLDGTLNVNLLDIAHDVRDGLEDTRTNVRTMGIRAEAGWRFPVTESFYVQPLATAAYAYADVENLDMRDYEATFEDTQSQRAALGVRLGGGMDLSSNRFSRIKYWLTARAWEEYAEDGNVQFQTDGDPLIIEDDISEGFEEVGLGASLTSPDENFSVFLSGNIHSGDHTDSSNITIGARLNW